MNKSLEALEEIAIQSVEAIIGKQEPLRTQKINELLETKQFKFIEKELKEREKYRKRCLELEEKLFNLEEKELKALEIIRYKKVNVFIFLHSGDLQTYNDLVEDNRKLTQEEYDLLKEVLQ